MQLASVLKQYKSRNVKKEKKINKMRSVFPGEIPIRVREMTIAKMEIHEGNFERVSPHVTMRRFLYQ